MMLSTLYGREKYKNDKTVHVVSTLITTTTERFLSV